MQLFRTYFPYREKFSTRKPWLSPKLPSTATTTTSTTANWRVDHSHWVKPTDPSAYPLFQLNSQVLDSLNLDGRIEDGAEFYVDKELRILYQSPSSLKVAQGTAATAA